MQSICNKTIYKINMYIYVDRYIYMVYMPYIIYITISEKIGNSKLFMHNTLK